MQWTKALGVVVVLALVVLLGGALFARAQQSRSEGVIITEDIPYFTGDADTPADPQRHTLDLYAPADVHGYPVVIYWHGGVWSVGSKEGSRNIGAALAAQGIGVVIANYRLSPDVAHPAHVQDAARATAWVVENIAAYGGDPSRIVLSGHSAGGHLASLLVLDPAYLAVHALSPAQITGVVSFSGVYVIDDWILSYAARGAFPDEDAQRAAASPLAQAEALPVPTAALDEAPLPPFLLLAAEQDYPQLISQQTGFETALAAGGISVQAHIIPNREHFSLVTAIGSEDDTATGIVLAWLETAFAPDAAADDGAAD